jgi:hypothetical protein
MWAVVALFAALMTVVCLAEWDVVAAAWWTLLLLISVGAWFWTRARWNRNH